MTARASLVRVPHRLRSRRALLPRAHDRTFGSVRFNFQPAWLTVARIDDANLPPLQHPFEVNPEIESRPRCVVDLPRVGPKTVQRVVRAQPFRRRFRAEQAEENYVALESRGPVPPEGVLQA